MAHTDTALLSRKQGHSSLYGTSTRSTIVMTSIIVVVMITIIVRKTFSNTNSDVLLGLHYTIASFTMRLKLLIWLLSRSLLTVTTLILQ